MAIHFWILPVFCNRCTAVMGSDCGCGVGRGQHSHSLWREAYKQPEGAKSSCWGGAIWGWKKAWGKKNPPEAVLLIWIFSLPLPPSFCLSIKALLRFMSSLVHSFSNLCQFDLWHFWMLTCFSDYKIDKTASCCCCFVFILSYFHFVDEGNETEVHSQPNSQLIWKQGRQLLRQ